MNVINARKGVWETEKDPLGNLGRNKQETMTTYPILAAGRPLAVNLKNSKKFMNIRSCVQKSNPALTIIRANCPILEFSQICLFSCCQPGGKKWPCGQRPIVTLQAKSSISTLIIGCQVHSALSPWLLIPKSSTETKHSPISIQVVFMYLTIYSHFYHNNLCTRIYAYLGSIFFIFVALD